MLKLSGRTRARRNRASHERTGHIGRLVRNVVMSVTLLLAILVGGGVAYTWYEGRQPTDSQTIQQSQTSQAPPTIKPTPPRPDAIVSVSTQLLTSPVIPGSNASMAIKTNAGANCTIKVEYNKVASKDSGLVPKVADEFGMATWTWTVEESAPLGKAPVTVTCANVKKSAMVIGDLQVVKTLPIESAAPTASN